jgi:hypothetical protein
MSSRVSAAAVALVACLACGLRAPAAGAATKVAAGGNLYLLQASGGTIEGSRLVLHRVDPRVTSFTDRPRRAAGSLTEERFAASWGKLFGSDPPNAALEVQGAPTSKDVALLVLRDPHYDAARHTLTYSVRRLRKTGDVALASFGRRADGNAVTRFGRSSLFVDDGGPEPVMAELQFEVPAESVVKVTFNNTVLELQGDGVGLMGVGTPAGEPVAAANVVVTPDTIEFITVGGGGIKAQMSAVFVAPAGERITGVASVPSGGHVTASTEFGSSQSIVSGPFAFPFE